MCSECYRIFDYLHRCLLLISSSVGLNYFMNQLATLEFYYHLAAYVYKLTSYASVRVFVRIHAMKVFSEIFFERFSIEKSDSRKVIYFY